MYTRYFLLPLIFVFATSYAAANETNVFHLEHKEMAEKGEIAEVGGLEELKDKNFADKIANGVSVVDFHAKWCGPCRKYSPIFEKVAGEWKGEEKFFKANVDDCGNISSKHKVYSIPTTIVFYKGKEIDRHVGSLKEDSLIQFITSAIGNIK